MTAPLDGIVIPIKPDELEQLNEQLSAWASARGYNLLEGLVLVECVIMLAAKPLEGQLSIDLEPVQLVHDLAATAVYAMRNGGGRAVVPQTAGKVRS